MKSTCEHFRDWEAYAFGFGYGTGEPHVVGALKTFLSAFEREGPPNSYNYERLEEAVGPSAAWLLINRLCQIDIIEYGTSPRFGWLTDKGEKLKTFVDERSTEDLTNICCNHEENYFHCSPEACNCGPNGYEEGRRCENPFWTGR